VWIPIPKHKRTARLDQAVCTPDVEEARQYTPPVPRRRSKWVKPMPLAAIEIPQRAATPAPRSMDRMVLPAALAVLTVVMSTMAVATTGAALYVGQLQPQQPAVAAVADGPAEDRETTTEPETPEVVPRPERVVPVAAAATVAERIVPTGPGPITVSLVGSLMATSVVAHCKEGRTKAKFRHGVAVLDDISSDTACTLQFTGGPPAWYRGAVKAHERVECTIGPLAADCQVVADIT
jgi:hypothetical protein